LSGPSRAAPARFGRYLLEERSKRSIGTGIAGLEPMTIYTPVPEVRQPLFTVERGGDRFQCDVVHRGDGWFVELLKNGVCDHLVGGPFDAPETAKEEAEKEREAINRGEMDGW
jgi:hypothetical protein